MSVHFNDLMRNTEDQYALEEESTTDIDVETDEEMTRTSYICKPITPRREVVQQKIEIVQVDTSTIAFVVSDTTTLDVIAQGTYAST